MDGILFINKTKGVTSRDIVNQISKKFNIKKVGHTGTLDPLAEGVMIICLGKATKLVDLLTSDDKEYIAEVTLGIKTDTLDITGKVLNTSDVLITEEEIINCLLQFQGSYDQEVPIYSAVKIHGKKLYEYAREKKEVILPKRKVTIKEIEFINFYKENNLFKFSFRCLVSKGTYIRSLIRDICLKLNVYGTMSNLRRTFQGNISIDKCKKVEDITKNDIVSINDVLELPKVKVDDKEKFKIINGQVLDNIYTSDKILFVDTNNKALAIYQVSDKKKVKPYIMLYNNLENGGKL